MPSVSTPLYPSITLPITLLPPLNERTPEAIMPLIEAWPHWHEIKRVALKEYQMESSRFDTLLPEYQRFLGLFMLGYSPLGMFSFDVDQIWHSHVLASHLWAQFCLEYHGKMINHVPQVPLHNGERTEICTTCRSCTNCSSGGQGGGGGDDEGLRRGTAQEFVAVYSQAFGVCPPPTVWSLGAAEGCATC